MLRGKTLAIYFIFLYNLDMKKAVVLLSGGLDSATTLAFVKSKGYNPYALSIFYGQRNQVELFAAKRVAAFLKVEEHKLLDLDLRLFGGSSLTDKTKVLAHEDNGSEIPNTYVPARNTIMLSLALAYAEVLESNYIFFGANIHDYSGYPDCRPEYIKAFEAMANLSTKRSVMGEKIHIEAPLINMSKAEIIKTGMDLGLDYSITHSCYSPIDNLACGVCSACFYRKKGFIEANVADPTIYSSLHKF